MRLWFAAVAVVLSAGGTVQADDNFLRDADHTLLARNVLHGDPQLAPLNLGVKVRDRVVTLWGPVPDLVLGVKAAELLRLQPEFRAIRNELYFEEDFSFLQIRRLNDLPPLQLTPAPPARRDAPVTLLPPVKVEEASVRPFGPPGTLTMRPMDKKPPRAIVAEKAAGVDATPKDAGKTQDAAIIRSGATGPRTSAVAPTPPESSLEQSIRKLQHSQNRFRELTFEVKDGVVTLRGPVQRAEALYEMAGAVSQVPGVVRVLVREN
jgi:hypothetical protein